MSIDENILIEKVKNGDQSAFRQLVDLNRDMVFSIALKIMRNSEDAEEVAMDAFMKAFEKIDSFKGDSAFSTWIYKICYNLSLSKLRKKELSYTDIDDQAYRIGDLNAKDALQLMIKAERSAELKTAIDKLDNDSKNILTLFYFEEKKLKEVSDILKISESNVKVKLHRGRKTLSTLLKSNNALIY